MGFLENISNNIQYNLTNFGFNPEADKYAKVQQQKAKELQEEKQVEDKKKEAEDERKRLEEQLKTQKMEDTGTVTSVMVSAIGTTTTIVLTGLFLGMGILGASLATNLNLYREWSFRIFYFIYGFLFSPIVILYVYLYRWWWKEKRPRFYALFPLIPYRLNHPWAIQFFSWLSYKPDDYVDALKEWRKEQNE